MHIIYSIINFAWLLWNNHKLSRFRLKIFLNIIIINVSNFILAIIFLLIVFALFYFSNGKSTFFNRRWLLFFKAVLKLCLLSTPPKFSKFRDFILGSWFDKILNLGIFWVFWRQFIEEFEPGFLKFIVEYLEFPWSLYLWFSFCNHSLEKLLCWPILVFQCVFNIFSMDSWLLIKSFVSIGLSHLLILFSNGYNFFGFIGLWRFKTLLNEIICFKVIKLNNWNPKDILELKLSELS